MADRLSTATRDALFRAFCDKPTVEHVSAKCRVHAATARRYRKADRWDERRAEIRARAQLDADYDISRAMAQSLRIVRAYKDKLAHAIERKNLRAGDANVADLERLIRLEAFVLGGAESRHEIVNEFTAWTDEEVERFATTGELPEKARGGAARAGASTRTPVTR